MWGRTVQMWESLERYLRVDAAASASERTRIRMVYGTGLIFGVVHALNLISLTIAYGGWTPQQTLTVIAALVVLGIGLSVRYTRSPMFFGTIYGVLTLVGIAVSALVTTVPTDPPHGINTSTLPTLCAAAALIAFVGTLRVSVLYIVASTALIAGLYLHTHSTNPEGIAAVLAWQRAVQAWIALLVIGPICTVIARLVYRSLDELEGALVRARSAEQARSNFLATMSHEIRTPLHGILGLSDMLSRSNMEATQQRQAELITVSANNLMEIIDEVLDMARLEDGTVKTTADPFSVRTLLQDISDLFAVKASQKSLWIGSEVDPAVPVQVIGDAPHLRQVMSNLAGNAIKFTREGGVRLGARIVSRNSASAAIQFYVQDSGVGIPLEDQADAFERFKQTDSAKTSLTKGTGLGLSICRELTDLMGGTLELQSTPGQGTVFYFTLVFPVMQSDQVAA
ncbi:MAG: ATP-binding protein [Litorimonas sp.]